MCMCYIDGHVHSHSSGYTVIFKGEEVYLNELIYFVGGTNTGEQ